ncbi:MAG TPA: molybdopterin cofactor-binding domain-containing protein [Xanthobacteraceae bacterium]|nr:molybdopterin cofactor-binding domain-containing protein [Xanthobacteraceae bacterium]
MSEMIVSRRAVLAGSGALIFSFSSAAWAQSPAPDANAPGAAALPPPPPLPGSLKHAPFLDSWIRVDADGAITVFSGKAELGQGIKTALLQVAAEQLDANFDRLKIVTADTARTANEGYTAGSHSMQDSGTAIMHAAAQVRQLLIGEAAKRAGAPPERMTTDSGAVVAPNGQRFGYGDLVAGEMLHVQASPQSQLKDPAQYKYLNRRIPRVDIPAKVTGGEAFVQDFRPDGLVHGRIVRPPSYGAVLQSADAAAVEKMPGVIKVVRDGSFLAVIAEREFQAIEAMRALAAAAHWQENAKLPDVAALPALLAGLPSREIKVIDQQRPAPANAKSLSATFTRPYISHGSIGPSCAVAQMQGDALTVWTHTQGVFPDRDAIAEMMRMPKDKVRCIHVQGSGCYGHNGADDAAGDAALLARALPGRPVRVQWTREQELAWEPYGPAMMVKVAAALDDSGKIADWNYELWSNTHSMRPGPAGALIAARYLAEPFPEPKPFAIPMPEGGGDRNSNPIYNFPSMKVLHHFLPEMPIRVSALRSLGAYMNIFSIESFMDELAAGAGTDPVEFRLKHLDDPRAREVVSTAAERFGWSPKPRASTPGHDSNHDSNHGSNIGYGFAFARYKNLAAYCAIACEAEINHETGRARMVRAVAAVDSGQVVNPDGIANQIEGAILQSMSWTLYENVSFDDRRITSVDWATYPILRFSAVPDSMEVHIINRPGLPFLGSGEAGQGPAAAAVANAIANATGIRFRDLPITAERIKAAIGV